jgi:Putative phage serine protease XkdF
MNIKKVQWNNSESRLNMSFPISKVDKEKRTVSGFATLDNIDRHGDIVTAEASEKAFARFRGNLREMHAPIAVGKVLSFHPEDYFDKESGKTFKGIYVNAYVSKGAQDTWEKVLDGTMTGFSIGGNIVNAGTEPGDKSDRRVIKEYDLMELSLVDSPANPLASIFSIQKNADGSSFVKGMAVDTTVENVYWCKKDQIASSTSELNKDCVVCNNNMENIGWIESSETEKGLSISKVIDQYLKKDDAPGSDHSATTKEGDAGVVDSKSTINLYPDQNKQTKKSESVKDSEDANKGGNNMADEKEKEVAEPMEKAADCPDCGKAMTLCECAGMKKAEDAEEKEEEKVEKAADKAETKEDTKEEENVEKSVTSAESTDSFAKMLTDMRDLFGDALTKNSADTEEKLQKSVETVESAKAEYMSAVDGLKKELTALTDNIADFFKRIESIEKRVDAYESVTAVQKSIGEVDNSSRGTRLQKNLEFNWQGSFLGVQGL